MKTCRHCGNVIANEHSVCLQCGRPAEEAQADAAEVPVATTQMNRDSWAEPHIPVDVFTSKAGVLHRSMAVNDLFAFKSQLVIGRAPTCDICLPHSSISRTHALLERLDDGI